MNPVIFGSLPWVYSFAAAVVLLQVCLILAISGKRYFGGVAIAIVALAGGALGEAVASNVGFPVFVGLPAGALCGIVLGYYLRPVGVGLALAFLSYSVASNIVPLQDVQYVAALVLFAYGLLLTDIAPSIVSGLLSGTIIALIGEWTGEPFAMTLELVTAVVALQLVAFFIPLGFASRSQRLRKYGARFWEAVTLWTLNP